MSIAMLILFYLIVCFSGIHLLVVLYNFFNKQYLQSSGKKITRTFKLSVLVPCRNEEANIVRLLEELAKQSIVPDEVLVLDDNSTDKTMQLAQDFIRKNDNNVRIFSGKALPEGWLGKNWACYQLANNATGDWLVFLDADVQMSNSFIASIVEEITTQTIGMFSVFPTQKKNSEVQLLLVAMMNWLLIGFLPIKLVSTSKKPSLAAANGQCMVFHRSVYDAIGGHASVAGSMVEDMALVRLVKKNNQKAKVLYGGAELSCEMYQNALESFRGYSKNFYPGFGTGFFGFTIFLVFLFFVFFLPFVLVWSNVIFLVPVVLILLGRILIARTANDSMLASVFLHILQIPAMIVLGIVSMYKFKTNALVWKNRVLK